MKIKPFTKDDWPQFLGKVFTRKEESETATNYADVFIVTNAMVFGVASPPGIFCSYEQFAEHYVFAQTGKPAGIEVKE